MKIWKDGILKDNHTCFIKFALKVTFIHVVTYIVCGMLAMFLFNYHATFSQVGMRDTNSLIVGLAPLFQIIRGFLFGVILWLLKDSFVYKKHGWLIIWAVIAIVGIFNTPGTSPGSIEYFIYCEPADWYWNLELGGIIEILTQTFLFSLLSFYAVKPQFK